MRKKNRETPEVNGSSTADIAFLLLIFFLMVTTIESNEGIPRKLPPLPENPDEIIESKLHKRNVFEIRVNSSDQLLVEGEYASVADLRRLTKEFILNYRRNPNLSDDPQVAVVSIKNDRGTSYKTYIGIQNELAAAYNEIRDSEARARFGNVMDEITEDQQNEVKDKFPMKVSEAEPENIGGSK
ncbi:MAG: biopolymer transporter ExbD [Bacteroidetes bacterium]|jgi:biopolymer transport protein ExbD|nr:biopolymer transporter ExbD [Bacteroidota bacterium]MBT5528441.1 biopolymer transporter ExbD [Cytophagia bacterium]MBT3421951.1 biopolymer transporter ExbD [Bacteroidota bacterium]MBT3802070.1 biopolymer transporter ExbD [Bacteroidota bacterium]MBT4729125.1 biopolymer transporter ExbD [Bacteroidota bacterium]